ncbi:MAG TPA: hypothetical protein VMZ06_18275 [Candidatus Bathyarchaeia archaeon]|nr:hypothetical protein [Candidatus Bathyarchaeia archaeon]
MTTWLAIGLLACAAASTAPPGAAPTVDVRTQLTPPVIPFHRQAQFSIVVDAPENVEVKLPDMLEKMGGVPVSDVRRDTKKLGKNRVRITETYVLDPVFTGKYGIKPVEVTWGENDGVVVASPGLVVRDLTESEKAEAEKFADNAGPASAPGLVRQYWRWITIAAVVAVGLAAVGVWVVWLRKRAEKLAPPPPAWEVAYRRLRELDERHLPEAGRYEPYYVDLSAILRYYIEDRFHLRAPEQTTQEFLAASSTSGLFSSDRQQLLSELLEHSDRVKFAQYVPSVPEMERSFASVLQFVDETVPKPQEDAQQAAQEAAQGPTSEAAA